MGELRRAHTLCKVLMYFKVPLPPPRRPRLPPCALAPRTSRQRAGPRRRLQRRLGILRDGCVFCILSHHQLHAKFKAVRCHLSTIMGRSTRRGCRHRRRARPHGLATQTHALEPPGAPVSFRGRVTVFLSHRKRIPPQSQAQTRASASFTTRAARSRLFPCVMPAHVRSSSHPSERYGDERCARLWRLRKRVSAQRFFPSR